MKKELGCTLTSIRRDLTDPNSEEKRRGEEDEKKLGDKDFDFSLTFLLKVQRAAPVYGRLCTHRAGFFFAIQQETENVYSFFISPNRKTKDIYIFFKLPFIYI